MPGAPGAPGKVSSAALVKAEVVEREPQSDPTGGVAQSAASQTGMMGNWTRHPGICRLENNGVP